MECKFQEIPVKLPKPLSLEERRKKVLYYIVGEWYMNKFNDKLPPLNKLKLIKNHKKRRMR